MSCRCSSPEIPCQSILPVELCLRLVKDADSAFEFMIKDEDGDPVDITADTVRLNVRDSIGGALKLAKSNGPGEHLDPVNGKTEFEIAHDDITDTLDDESTLWVYEVRHVAAGGDETVCYQGDFEIRLSVAGG